MTGYVSSGKLDAADKEMVISLLRNRGMYPLEINEVNIFQKDIKISTHKKIPLKDISLFCKQFHTMLNAGVTVIGCLDLLRKQTENINLASIIHKVYEDVQKGLSLSEAMKLHSKVFPIIVTSMLEIGEISGNLDLVLDRLSIYLEKENKIKQKVKSSMVYPKAVGIIALCVVMLMLTFVVPNFVSIFKNMGGELPLPTKILINISNTLRSIKFLFGASVAVCVLILGFKRFNSSEKGKRIVDGMKLKLPLVGNNLRKIIASRFSRSFSLLLKSGVPLIQALEVAGNLLDNVIITDGLTTAKEDVRRGESLAQSLEIVSIFPIMVIHMISIGEESGALDSVVEKVADFYDDELDVSISKLLSMLEPIMIVGIAVVVGAIVLAMVLPIFSMYKQLGK
jgi:type IV pilus assembly protein PilC